METVAAGPGAEIGEGLSQAVLAVKPVVGPAEGSQVFLLVPQSVGGQRRFCHRDGFHGLLVVVRLLLAVRIPTATADRPKEALERGFLVKKGEGCLRYFEERFVGPAFRGN